LSALQYSDLIVTPITGQHAAGIGDLRHLGYLAEKMFFCPKSIQTDPGGCYFHAAAVCALRQTAK